MSGAGTGPASPDGTPPGSGDLADVLVDDLAGFADALGLTTFHLAGFSLGAMTALRFASRYPGRLRTLVLVGVDIEHEPSASVTRALMDPDRVEREDPAWAEQLERRHGPVQGAGAWRALLATIVREVERRRRLSPDELRAARVPTLVVGGDRDVFVPAAHLVALYRQLPDAQLLVVPDCGHQVMAARPGLFNEAAGGFYRATAEVAGRRAAAGPGAAADILRPAAGAAGRGIGPVPSTAPETATVATPVRGGAA